jgi:gas vesicle protein
MTDDRKEYAIAFAIGAMVGAGATMLLAPARKKQRLIYKLEPAARRARKHARRLRKSIRHRG